jgi:hypothetical protein
VYSSNVGFIGFFCILIGRNSSISPPPPRGAISREGLLFFYVKVYVLSMPWPYLIPKTSWSIDLFVEVAQVLLPMATARRLLLSISQKAINNCELSLLHLNESNDDGATHHFLELQRRLYALVALTCASSWNKTEEVAWLLLSSILWTVKYSSRFLCDVGCLRHSANK